MNQSNPISLSQISLSHITAISVCIACTDFVVHFAIIMVKGVVTGDYCVCQETAVRGQ